MSPSPPPPDDLLPHHPGEAERPNKLLRLLYAGALLVGAALAYWEDAIDRDLRILACFGLIFGLAKLGNHPAVWPRRQLKGAVGWCFFGGVVAALLFKVLVLNTWYTPLALRHPTLPDNPLMLLFWLAVAGWWYWSCNMDQEKAILDKEG